jgi:protein SCO1/2
MALSALKAAFRMDIKSWLVLAFLMVMTGCSNHHETLPFYNDADFTAQWISKSDAAYANIHTIDTFRFFNQLGRAITKDSLNGHIYVANFFFTSCPGICPAMMNNLAVVQQAFRTNKQVKLVSFSVMPWADSVKRLYTYGQQHQIDPDQWYLLTGNKKQIYALARRSYFSEKALGLSRGDNAFLHTESLLLIDKKSRIRGIYNATDSAQMKRVIEDMQLLLQE